MAYIFGDSFDLYATPADMLAGYWDSGNMLAVTLIAGRFAGSQGFNCNASGGQVYLVKNSGANDAVHHIVCAFRQTAALSGTTLATYFQLSDGATNQCCIVFRSDGAVLLTSATPAGTVLATYAGAVTAVNTWFAFEFEVVINNTTGAFRARKNGNTSNDFDSGATLNTRPGTNSYANKLTMGQSATLGVQQLDDLLWRSDASSVPWAGDIRCYTRMPASDASAQFSKSQATATTSAGTAGSSAIANGTAKYPPQMTAPYDGSITSVTVNLVAGYTGNMKCAVFAAVTSSQPGAVLATATPISNPATGNNTFTFPTPAVLTRGTNFFVGFDSDTASGTWNAAGAIGFQSTTAYASFPVATPSITGSVSSPVTTAIFTLSGNYALVDEPQQDGATSYVYDSTVNDADFYNIAALGVTPTSVVAVTTRGFLMKSDAGTRSASMRLKSGSTTVATPTLSLSTSFGWAWRTDLNDPNTSAAWTPANVNAAQIGPLVVS